MPRNSSSSGKLSKAKQNFNVYTKNKSFVTSSGPTTLKKKQQIGDFNYSINVEELKAFEIPSERPMRKANEEHLTILTNDQDAARQKYLNARWNASPRDKYYFPEATSWRYGWVQASDEISK